MIINPILANPKIPKSSNFADNNFPKISGELIPYRIENITNETIYFLFGYECKCQIENRMIGVEYKKCSVSVINIFGIRDNRIKYENTSALLLVFSDMAEYFLSKLK